MPLQRRGRPANEHDLAAVREYLRAHPGATDTEIAKAMTTPTRRFTRAMANSRLSTLRGRGVVDHRNSVIQEELWPAFLLLDVPRSKEPAVRAALSQHPEDLTQFPALGLELECNFVVTTVVSDVRAVDALRMRCLRAGAVKARAVMRLPAAS